MSKDTRDTTAARDPHIDDDEILDLVHGLVSERSRRAWLDHISTCSNCEERLRESLTGEARRRALFSLTRGEDGSLSLQRRLSGLTDETAPTPTLSPLARVRGWLQSFRRPILATGSVLVVASTYLLVFRPLDSSSWNGEIGTLPVSMEQMRIRGDEQNGDEALARGLESYEAGRFREASVHLERSRVSGPRETVRLLYLASSQALQGKAEPTVRLLEGVALETLPDPWGVQSQWTLQAALRALDRSEEADSIVRNLSTRPDQWGRRARELLGENPGAQ